jgi:hypothetical protein
MVLLVVLVITVIVVIFEIIKYIIIDEMTKYLKGVVIEALYKLVTDYDLAEKEKIDNEAINKIADMIIEKHYKNKFDYKEGKAWNP